MGTLEHVYGVPPATEPCPLAALAVAVRDGRSELSEELFTRLLPRVRNLVRYLVRGDRDVDDLSQDALVALYRGLHSFRGEGTFKAWADRVVARSVFAARRRVSMLPIASRDGEVEDLTTGSELDATPAQESYVLRRQLATQLDRLPDAQRHAFVLHHALGMGVAEISAELGVPEETVRSRLRVARQQLRLGLEDQTPLVRAGEQR